jgi:hypothetical protein
LLITRQGDRFGRPVGILPVVRPHVPAVFAPIVFDLGVLAGFLEQLALVIADGTVAVWH